MENKENYKTIQERDPYTDISLVMGKNIFTKLYFEDFMDFEQTVLTTQEDIESVQEAFPDKQVISIDTETIEDKFCLIISSWYKPSLN